MITDRIHVTFLEVSSKFLSNLILKLGADRIPRSEPWQQGLPQQTAFGMVGSYSMQPWTPWLIACSLS